MIPKLFGRNKWLKRALLAVGLQQCLVALGTYLMGNIAEDASQNHVYLYKLIIFGLCLTLSGSLFHYFVCFFSVRAQKTELLNYFKKYISGNFNNPSLWRDPSAKSNIHDIMLREGPETISSTIAFMIDAVATFLNIILNTISIMFITGFEMGWVILTAGSCGLIIVHLASKNIANVAEIEMREQNFLTGHLSKSWDNIILGNKVFFSNWFLIFEKCL